jgi:hypothetical protein
MKAPMAVARVDWAKLASQPDSMPSLAKRFLLLYLGSRSTTRLKSWLRAYE